MRISLLLMVLLFLACSNEAPKEKVVERTQSLEKLSWIIGKWRKEDTNKLELWSEKGESYYGGMVVELNDQDKAVIKEVISLEGREDGFYYGAKVNGQNSGRKIDFKMSNLDFESPVFTNESHDFPKAIKYIKVGSDRIKVELSGTGGEPVTFYYVREE